ncbi:hypothetical protein ACQKGL_17000 [Ensifer adhaerens]|uniref:hypothetical protein n=1 Tax=Ensifer adhaerens TaxID=106592 RepID=UPI003D02640A
MAKCLVGWQAEMRPARGYAELKMRDNGEVEARLASGETYLLAETTILRLA